MGAYMWRDEGLVRMLWVCVEHWRCVMNVVRVSMKVCQVCHGV